MEVKKGYKQTEVGVIPEDWEVKKLGDVLKVIGGGAFKSSDSCTSGIKWLKIANVGINQTVWDSESYLPFELEKDNENFLLKSGDYVIALTRPILDRKLKIARLINDDVPALLNQRVGRIEIEENNDIDFAYFLFQKYETISGLLQSMAGTDPPNLSNKGIYNIDCALPPTKSEQTAIATTLSDADALITSLEKLIDKKRAIKQGAMQKLLSEPGFAGLKDKQDFEMGNNPENPAKVILSESECSGLKDNQDWKINKNPENPAKVMLSESECSGLKDNQDWKINKNPENPANPINPDSDKWEVKKLGEIFSITAGGDLDTDNFSSFYDDKYCYPIYSNSLSDKGLYGYSSMFTSEKDTITVTARGTVGYANSRDHRYTAIGRVLILNPIQKLDCFFISELINNRLVFANESTGVPQLTAPQISKYEISIPTFEEQTRIATILSDMDAEITVLEQKLAKYKQIKQGMMQELLTGKIRLNQDLQD